VELDRPTGDTLRSPTVTPKLQRLAAQAAHDPDRVFTTLAYLIDTDFLREAYRQTSKSSAAGIDGVTAQQYAEHLDENLRDLHERLCSGRYQAAPVERVWIEKDDGGQRPIGKPTFEDKIIRATRQCGSKGNEDAITSGNFVCRPAGAKPVRPRVSPPEPVGSLATIPEMWSAMRRRANMGAMGHAAPKPIVFPEAEGPDVPEGNHTPLHRCRPGEEGGVSGGVFDHGTYEEDGPVTWEALASPRPIPVSRSTGDPSPTHDTFAGARVVGPTRGTEQAPASR
jgi:hypothetical protein